MFIVLEGVDGSGKSTLSSALNQQLQQNYATIHLKEPTDTTIYAKKIKKILSGNTMNEEIRVELLELFYQDRLWNIEHNIKPALDNGKIVLCDRFYYSTAAYQGINPEDAMRIAHSYCSNEKIIQPDIILFLNISPENSLKRVHARKEEIAVFEKIDFLTRVSRNYLYLFSDDLFKETVFTINAGLEQQDIFNQCYQLILEKLTK